MAEEGTVITTRYTITENNVIPIPDDSTDTDDQAATSNVLTITATYHLDTTYREILLEEPEVELSNITPALSSPSQSNRNPQHGRGVKPTHVEGSFIIDANSDETDFETNVPNSVDARLEQISQVVENAAKRHWFF